MDYACYLCLQIHTNYICPGPINFTKSNTMQIKKDGKQGKTLGNSNRLFTAEQHGEEGSPLVLCIYYLYFNQVRLWEPDASIRQNICLLDLGVDLINQYPIRISHCWFFFYIIFGHWGMSSRTPCCGHIEYSCCYPCIWTNHLHLPNPEVCFLPAEYPTQVEVQAVFNRAALCGCWKWCCCSMHCRLSHSSYQEDQSEWKQNKKTNKENSIHNYSAF